MTGTTFNMKIGALGPSLECSVWTQLLGVQTCLNVRQPETQTLCYVEEGQDSTAVHCALTHMCSECNGGNHAAAALEARAVSRVLYILLLPKSSQLLVVSDTIYLSAFRGMSSIFSGLTEVE